ncbi:MULTISPECIES: type A2 lanthipeptide [unclassified Streptomyces]|uniref:type A2 lanthipeptide n=1 Tax=unclassified Streptomyces TaxID=2593676 RepID=UPI000C26E4E5|nr:type A2 lanthipeptide [Streptomyces sp. CB02959]PJN40411.1 type A2 lantipeptide [Streptomyces sp. CB02959]
MNNAQVQTQEISDADLDNVSGGLVGGVLSTVTTTVDSVAPVSGVLGTATGLVQQTTGLNVTGVAGGLTAGL